VSTEKCKANNNVPGLRKQFFDLELVQTFGNDFFVRAVWREKDRSMIMERQLEAILAITANEYFDQLTTAGESM
jgi:hypothetical protein